MRKYEIKFGKKVAATSGQLGLELLMVTGRGKSSSISSTMIFWNCKIIGNTIMNHVKLFFIGTNLHIKDGEP